MLSLYMAFQVGITKIRGTIDGVSFYHSQFGWLVRMKGGPTRKQSMTSPAFERSRENSAEFKACSMTASSIRKTVLAETGTPDPTLYHRLMKLMRRLADEDRSSLRGESDPAKGLNTETGRKLMGEFRVGEDQNLLEVFVKYGFLKESGELDTGIIEKISQKRDKVTKPNLLLRYALILQKDYW